MKSTLLGNWVLDQKRLAKDLAILDRHPPAPDVYSEFRVGTFHTYNLRNAGSDVNNMELNGSDVVAQPTPLGEQLSYLGELLEVLFEPIAIRLVRIMEIRAGMLFPHRDMMELGEAGRDIVRVHVMLKSNPTALHSESSEVFRMEEGDVWFLHAHATHAAINRAATPRYTLVVDLDRRQFDYRMLSRRPGVRSVAPTLITRSRLTEAEREALMGMKIVVGPHNALDFFQMFVKLHFHKDLSADESLDLIRQFFHGTSEERTATDFIDYLVQNRSAGQRFPLSERWMNF